MSDLTVTAFDLSADHALNPLALSTAPSRLSWRTRGRGNPVRVDVQAATTLEAILDGVPDLWETSVEQVHAWLDWPAEIMLKSRASVWWRVRPTTSAGISEWSEVAHFEVALPNPGDWDAQWITHPQWTTIPSDATPLPQLRRTFDLPATPLRARLYVTGLGVQETFINSFRVGDAFLEPGYADYSARVPAAAWDVTELLTEGRNEIFAVLGTGMSWVTKTPDRYSKLWNLQYLPRYLAQLEITLTTGQTIAIVSDKSWASSLGDTALAHWYGGQDVTVNAPMAAPVAAAVLGAVATFPAPWFTSSAPVRVTDTLRADKVTNLDDGHRIIDFGLNIAGQFRATVSRIPESGAIEIWPTELLDADGHIDQASTGTPIFDRLLASPGSEFAPIEFAPTLVYHGFRYAEVIGLAPTEGDDAVWAEVLRADLPAVGSTTTSSNYLNRLHTIIDRAIQSNMYSVFTDCPHREKLGWIEELYLCFDALSRGYDVSAHLRQTMTHLRDAQLESGMIPSIAPEFINFAGDAWQGSPDAFRDDPNWGGAIVHVPWRLYETYADLSALSENWEAMQDYVAYLRTREADGILSHGLGDWITVDDSTPRAMVATFGYIGILERAADVARVLGLAREATRYAENAIRVRNRYIETFKAPDGLTWGSGSQACYAFAFDLGLVDAEDHQDTWRLFMDSIDLVGRRITVGENALPSFLRVLSAANHNELINELIRETTGPGYGHQLATGATALTESWQGPTGPLAQGSQNHFMLGVIDDWITGTVCGLRQAQGSIGWRSVRIAPAMLVGLDWAETSFDAPSGDMRVRWDRDGENVVITVILPPGVEGTLELAGLAWEVGSGTHTFRTANAPEQVLISPREAS